MSAAARVSGALGLSLLLHGAMLAMIDHMPRSWQLGPGATGQFGARVLHARLRAAEADAGPLGSVGDRSAATAPRADAAPSTPPARERDARAGPPPAEIGTAPRPALGVVAPPRYLPASELDERPQIRTRPEPEFPPGTSAASGRVLLRLHVGENGGVDEIAVLGVEPERAFEEPAVRAFAGALFTPGRKQGVAVRSAVTIEVLFGIELPALPGRQPEGPLFQPPSRGRPAPGPTRKESP